MMTYLRVDMDERVVLLRNGAPTRAYGPGVHWAWGTHDVLRFYTAGLTFTAHPAVRAVLPADWFTEVTVEPNQRAVLVKDGRPQAFLRPGAHWYWTVDPGVALTIFSVDEPIGALTKELLAVIPHGELVTTLVNEHERGLLYVQGRFVRVLQPGRHAAWTTVDAPVSVRTVDMRRRQLAVPAQELMTRDKVTLRLTVAVDWAPLDAAGSVHVIADPEAALYTLVQLAVREYVAGVTLDELLEGRDAMTRYLVTQATPEAERFGVRLHQVGVKDVILPGDMKLLLNRVIEAEKEAAANVILRREAAAATRTLATPRWRSSLRQRRQRRRSSCRCRRRRAHGRSTRRLTRARARRSACR